MLASRRLTDYRRGLMFSLIKKLFSFLFVLAVVALVLNLNIGGKPARQHAENIWHNPSVQKVYQSIKQRVMAVIRKDISVEDAFKPDLPAKKTGEKPSETPIPSSNVSEKTKVIHLEKLDAKDREELDQILQKAASDS
jgi:hypothetical protein